MLATQLRTFSRCGSRIAAPNDTQMPARKSWAACSLLPINPCITQGFWHAPAILWTFLLISITSAIALTQCITMGFPISAAMYACHLNNSVCRSDDAPWSLSIPHSPIISALLKSSLYAENNSSWLVASSSFVCHGCIPKLRGVMTPSAVFRCVWKSISCIKVLSLLEAENLACLVAGCYLTA